MPGADQGIEESHQDRGENQEAEELHMLGNRTGHDRGGGRCEHGLENEVGPPRVGRVIDVGGVRQEFVATVFCGATHREESIEVTGIVRIEAPKEVEKNPGGNDPAVLEEDVDRVLFFDTGRTQGSRSRGA